MNINAMLEAIYAIQKQLDKEAHHSLKEYVKNTHRHVREMETTYGLMLYYGKRVGGYESVPEPSSLSKPSQKDGALVEA
ncbi:MAG: hypothetical protein QME81_20680 [bacterium]|nr:hypothetical protein [bacterium]